MPSLAGVNCQLWFDDNELFDFSFGKKREWQTNEVAATAFS